MDKFEKIKKRLFKNTNGFDIKKNGNKFVVLHNNYIYGVQTDFEMLEKTIEMIIHNNRINDE